MNIETQIHLDKFQPRWYQLPILDAIENKGYRRVIAILPRRAGKDITAWNLCIRQALMKVGVYFYVFPTYAQGKKILWDSVTISGIRFLEFIPPQTIESTNSQEMKIRFKNGSLIQIVGSDNIDSLVGTNPIGIIYSEYALQLPSAYSYLRPVLAANDGWAVFLSCVTGDTLVITQQGIMRIEDVCAGRLRYNDMENTKIWGLGGYHEATQFFYQKKVPLICIENHYGYSITCTPNHKLWNGKEWVRADSLNIKDELPIQYDQQIFGRGVNLEPYLRYAPRHVYDGIEPEFYFETCCPHFFYLVGLLFKSGTLLAGNTILMETPQHHEIITLLRRWGFMPYSKSTTRPLSCLKSTRLAYILRRIFDFSEQKVGRQFPKLMYKANKDQMTAFLQGIFDINASLYTRSTHTISIFNLEIQVLKEIQKILLLYGIVCKTMRSSPNCRLYIPAVSVEKFYKQIGFRVEKKKNWYEHYKKKPSSKTAHRFETTPEGDKFYFSKITKIELLMGDVYDFVIPDTHSFFSNGFISHNTPRGKNHLYELFQIAQNSPDWFAYKLTVEDTNHIPIEEIEREKQEGVMSEDLIYQEYYCSWDMGVEGNIYGKHIDVMKVKGRIGEVPWEPSFKVHTAWDIGVADSTSIIFFQTVGQTVRIIDYYEKTGVGLDHYVKVLQSKPYVYGKHIAPHDMRQRVWTEGAITRIEKARQMGINFVVADNIEIVDGIEAVRASLNKIWIDQTACATLIKALENYRYEWDERRSMYKTQPLHNWASHAADALRYLCVSLPKTSDSLSAEELEKRYQEAVYGKNANMPAIFRDDLPPY